MMTPALSRGLRLREEQLLIEQATLLQAGRRLQTKQYTVNPSARGSLLVRKRNQEKSFDGKLYQFRVVVVA